MVNQSSIKQYRKVGDTKVRIKLKRRSKRSQIKRFTRSRAGNFFYMLFLIVMGSFSVLPLVYCVVTSFKPLDEILVFPPKFFVSRPTLENYLALPGLLSNLKIPLSRYVFNSLFVTIVSTILYVFVATMAAFALSKSKIKHKNKIFLLVQFALLFNGYVLALPQYLIFSSLKMIDTYHVMILPYVASSMGVFLMKQYMEESVPDALLEAARIDGASVPTIFFRIVLPMIKPCWLTLTLFGFRDVWSAIPNGTVFSESIKTLPTIMQQITSGGMARSGSAMAVTVIMMIPPIIVYFISQSNVKEAMNSAGIK